MMLLAFFSQFGDIIECRVLKDKHSGVHKGVAFVQFNVRGEANRALSLNGHRLEGVDRPLIVKYAEDQHKKRDRRMIPPMQMNPRFRHEPPYMFPVDHLPVNGMMPPPKSMGYGALGNGPPYYPGSMPSPYNPHMKYGGGPSGPNPNRMMEWFDQMPPVGYDGMPVGGPGPHLPHGHGHDQEHEAYEPLDLDNFPHPRGGGGGGYMMGPREGPDADYGPHPVSVVVNRLPAGADVPMLQDLFSPYGRIVSAHVEGDESSTAGDGGRLGGSSGRAFIQMESIAQAQNAVQALNGSNPFMREGMGPLQVDLLGSGPGSNRGRARHGDHNLRG